MSTNHHILCLETSTSYCSVAIASHEGCLTSLSAYMSHAHAQCLPLIFDDLLDSCALSRGQLNAIALSRGPGSYTGLRIGAAAAKALCYALRVPLITTSPLQLMAEEVSSRLPSDALVLPLIPQRGTTYAYALYNGALDLLIGPEMGPLSSELLSRVASLSPLYLLTPSPRLPEAIIRARGTAQDILQLYSSPSATQMCSYASLVYLREDFTEAESFKPLYPLQRSYPPPSS